MSSFTMCGAEKVIHLDKVVGYEGRVNSVLYFPPTIRDSKHVVVYFGGDIQTFANEMAYQPMKANYYRWNLDSTCMALGSAFPMSHIIVVHASRVERDVYNCYDNFVPSNIYGVPNHTPNYGALCHLEMLIADVLRRVKNLDATGLEEDDDTENASPTDEIANTVPLGDVKIALMGFSKGCVVLNQIVYEFHYVNTLTPDDEKLNTLISKIEKMYYLDGGHCGKVNTWITSKNLLETLSRLKIQIDIHVSPYQVEDRNRPWIGKEAEIFYNILSSLAAPVKKKLHSGCNQAGLLTHFNVLKCVLSEISTAK